MRILQYKDLENLPAPKWLVAGFLPEGLCVLYGPPGVGKSFLALDVAMHIAAGESWQGRSTAKGTAVYIYAEGSGGLRLRVPALAEWNQMDEQGSMLFIPQAVDLGGERPAANLGQTAVDIEEARVAAGFPPVVLLVVDTLARNMAGDENESAHMGEFVKSLDRLREFFKTENSEASVLVIHHAGHNAVRERGSSVLRGAADVMVSLRDEAKGSCLLDPYARVLRVSCATKPPKDAAEWADFAVALRTQYPVEQTSDGIDDDGEPILIDNHYVGATWDLLRDEQGEVVTTCVVVPARLETPEEHAQRDSNRKEFWAKLEAENVKIRESVLEYLTREPDCSQRMITGAVCVPGKIAEKRVRTVLDALEREGLIKVEKTSEKRGYALRYSCAGNSLASDLEARLVRRAK